MIQNLLKISLRNLWREKYHTLINIVGLAMGIASSLVIFLFVYNDLSYDRFHKNAGKIYKVYQHSMLNGEESYDAWSPVPMAAVLKSEYPEVADAVRLYQSDNIYAIVDQEYFNIENALYVDSSFFVVFSFDLVRGDKRTILSEPHTVVLTESTAAKMFGKQDPMDKMIRFENDTSFFRVAGISQDPPENSHFDYDMLISMDAFWDNNSSFWLRNNVNTYILLQDGFFARDLEEKFPEMIKKYVGPQVQQFIGISMEEDFARKGNYLQYKLQPIRDIHLNTLMNHGLKPSSTRKYVYIFSLIGLFIILIAGINFVNLSTAMSAERAHEVCLRKILGSSSGRIISQFLVESALISLISLILAIALVINLLPFVNRMTGLSLSLFSMNSWMLAAILVVSVVIIGILAGFYPAYLLSSFKINTALKDNIRSGNKRTTLRNILVIVQFFIAIVILSGMLVVFQQLKYMLKKDLGFNKENVMIIKRAYELNGQLGSFMEEVKKLPGIVNISNSTGIPGIQYGDNAFMVEGRSQSETYVLQVAWVDYSFISTFNMKIADGRDFSEDFTTDSKGAIINEATVKKMNLKNPVGTRLMSPDQNGEFTYFPIIGVVQDFHYMSLHHAIQPCIMLVKPVQWNWGGYLSVRLDKGDKTLSIRSIENTWKQFTNDRPMEYSFLAEDLQRLYKEEKQISSLSVIFTMLAIFVACLGLLGLVLFLTIKRTKEIGIRKIVGAGIWNIITLLSFNTVKLILISSLIAWPVAYIFLKNWLEDFPFRVGINPMIFLLSSLVVLFLSMMTIVSRTWFAATRNPADALRYE
jgi:putative ABC transport system permease protein